MKIIRWVLGRIILFIELVTTPKGVVRDENLQNIIDQKTAGYSLYQFEACPFCVKVRKTINKHSLNIEYRDAKNNLEFRQELESLGGKVKVPCLRMKNEDGEISWLYESDTIIEHLEELISEELAAA